MALKVPALYTVLKVMLYGAGAGVSGAVCSIAAVSGIYIM
jgi:hypothetical protein